MEPYYCDSCSTRYAEIGDGLCPDPECKGEPLTCAVCKGTGSFKFDNQWGEADGDCDCGLPRPSTVEKWEAR